MSPSVHQVARSDPQLLHQRSAPQGCCAVSSVQVWRVTKGIAAPRARCDAACTRNARVSAHCWLASQVRLHGAAGGQPASTAVGSAARLGRSAGVRHAVQRLQGMRRAEAGGPQHNLLQQNQGGRVLRRSTPPGQGVGGARGGCKVGCAGWGGVERGGGPCNAPSCAEDTAARSQCVQKTRSGAKRHAARGAWAGGAGLPGRGGGEGAARRPTCAAIDSKAGRVRCQALPALSTSARKLRSGMARA